MQTEGQNLSTGVNGGRHTCSCRGTHDRTTPVAETFAYKFEVLWLHPSKPTAQTTHPHVPNDFTRPVKTACDSDARIKQEALALRVVHRRHATKAARLAHLLHMLSKNLLDRHKQMHEEEGAIAGKFYTNDCQVGFDEHGAMVPWPISTSAAMSPLVRASLI